MERKKAALTLILLISTHCGSKPHEVISSAQNWRISPYEVIPFDRVEDWIA